MLHSEFQEATLEELAKITGVAKSRWSLYFNNKKTVSEKTLMNAAIKLNMKVEELLFAINERRAKALAKKLIDG